MSSDFDMESFISERNEVLRSLDRKKIEAYAVKYKVRLYTQDETGFWAAIHRARLSLVPTPFTEAEMSREWLSAHGYRPVPIGE